MTEQVITLEAKILAAAKNAGYVQKSSEHGQGYKFAGDEAISEKFREAMIAEGVLVYPASTEEVRVDIIPREGKAANILATIRRTFVATDGVTGISVAAIGQGMDAGDKAVYKALTGSKKYAYRELVMMVTGDDPENESAEEKAERTKPAEAPKAEETPEQKLARGKRKIFAKAKDVGLSKDGLANLRLSVTGKQSSKLFTIEDVKALLKAMDDPAQLAAAAAGGEVVE